jgi:hypothetical protein
MFPIPLIGISFAELVQLNEVKKATTSPHSVQLKVPDHDWVRGRK